MAHKRRTPNNEGVLYAVDSASGDAAHVTATAHALDVNVVSGGGAGGTQYQELATTTSATGTLALGRYLSSLPVLTNGQMNEPVLDSSSRLLIGALPAGSAVIGHVITDTGSVAAVTGTVTANAGTNLNTSALALAATQTDKSQFTKLTDGTDTALITGAGELNVLGTAQPGVDIGDVTINNAAGASAVNIQDGGNSLTVDGTVAVSNFPTTVDTNSGNKSASTLRVVLATDQPALTNKLLVTPDSVALPANQSVNISQMNGVTVTMGNGVSGTGVQRVTLASDSTGQVALAAGSAAIGKLTANSGVTIGAVEIAAAQTLATVTTVSTVTALGTGTTGPMKAEDAAHASGDQGFPAWGVRNDNGATTYGADQDYGPLATDKNGRTLVAQKAATGTQTTVASSATNVTLLAANSARLGATIYNDSTVTLYVRLAATATTSNFTVKLFSDAYYEVPFGYSGIVDGIWASATGNSRITELT